MFKAEVIGNELVGSLELSYFHPTFHTWITRIGSAGTMIQYKSVKNGGSGDITEIRDKIINTLVKDYPHLKAECFRNACLSIGKSFGRDLNREYTDTYNPLIKAEQQPDIKDATDKILILFETYEGKDKQTLQAECSNKIKFDKFDMEYAEKIAKKLGGSL